MLLTSTRLCIVTGAALVAGGIAFTDSSLKAPQAFLNAALFQEAVSSKGDRLASVQPAETSENISIVEIVGLAEATVILRGRNGEVLYRSDPRSGITTIAKNTDMPVLTLKEDMQGPAVQHPAAPTSQSGEEPRKTKRQTPVGCMGDVSPLVSASANRSPSLCLASAESSLL